MGEQQHHEKTRPYDSHAEHDLPHEHHFYAPGSQRNNEQQIIEMAIQATRLPFLPSRVLMMLFAIEDLEQISKAWLEGIHVANEYKIKTKCR